MTTRDDLILISVVSIIAAYTIGSDGGDLYPTTSVVASRLEQPKHFISDIDEVGEPNDKEIVEESLGRLVVVNADPLFTSVSTALKFSLIGANIEDNPHTYTASVNYETIPGVDMEGATIIIPPVLSEGVNIIAAFVHDDQLRPAHFSGEVWAGSRLVSFSLVEETGMLVPGSVRLSVVDDTFGNTAVFEETIESETGEFIVQNAPAFDIKIVAEGISASGESISGAATISTRTSLPLEVDMN